MRLPPGLRLRLASHQDAPALLALLARAYSREADPHRDPRLVAPDTLEGVRASLASDEVLVAEDGTGRLVGTVALRGAAHIRRLAVAPDAMGRGVGGALLEAAVARAAAAGVEAVELTTQEGHPWLTGFYRRHGFVDVATEETPDGARWRRLRRALRGR